MVGGSKGGMMGWTMNINSFDNKDALSGSEQ